MFATLQAQIMAALAAVALVLILGAGWYIHSLRADVAELTKANTELSVFYKQKEEAAKTCSESVDKLKEASDKQTEDAKKAVAKAKKEAVIDYISANDVLFKKPETPVVTAENAKDFGGTDTAKQLTDYLQTQKLFNDMVINKGIPK